MFNIKEKKTLHSIILTKTLRSVAQIRDDLIVSSMTDNKLYIWDLNKISNNHSLDLFLEFGVDFKFIIDEFNDCSPIILIYNLFKQIGENVFNFIMIYDFKREKCLKRCQIMNCHFKPLFLFKIFFFVAHDTNNSNAFVFIDSSTFEIFYRISSEKNYIIKQVDPYRFILSGKNQLYEVYIKSKTEIFTEKLLDYSINKILWSTINYENLIYYFDEKINIYNFKLKQLDIKEIKIGNVLNKAENAFSTNNGLILVLRIQSCIIGYNTQNGEQVLFKTVNDLRSLMIIDNYLHLEISNKNKIIRY